ncbi:hypothetical protein [Dyella sp.]|uniref:hypothetical protein n=1 Tax=Dyella sp. TaxID=1869338 RepID=UPI002ED18DC6
MKGHKALGMLAWALVVPAIVWAQATPSTTAAPSDSDLSRQVCVIGEEKFVPADYYYCLAVQSYGQHKYRYAERYFKEAASWASKPAQYVLGIMALNGDQQPANRPLALAWLALASERPDSKFAGDYNNVLAHSSQRDKDAANALLVDMRRTYADDVAARRAQERYEHGMASLKNVETYCMAGLSQANKDEATLDDPLEGNSCQRKESMVARIDKTAAAVFDGWTGHVTVGALQQVPGAPGK